MDTECEGNSSGTPNVPASVQNEPQIIQMIAMSFHSLTAAESIGLLEQFLSS